MPSSQSTSLNADKGQFASSAVHDGATPPAEPDAMEAKRIADMRAKIAMLEGQIGDTKAKKDEVAAKLKNPDAQATVSRHIKLLHKYNEIRDVGQGLMGIIADQRSVRIVDLYDEFGLVEGD